MTLFRDTEATLITYLAAQLATVPVVGKVPKPRPDQFVRIERLGGPRETRVTEAANFAVEAWAVDDSAAVDLLNQTRRHLYDVEGAMFGADEYGGPTRFPDPDSRMSRYSASFTIRFRAI